MYRTGAGGARALLYSHSKGCAGGLPSHPLCCITPTQSLWVCVLCAVHGGRVYVCCEVAVKHCLFAPLLVCSRAYMLASGTPGVPLGRLFADPCTAAALCCCAALVCVGLGTCMRSKLVWLLLPLACCQARAFICVDTPDLLCLWWCCWPLAAARLCPLQQKAPLGT